MLSPKPCIHEQVESSFTVLSEGLAFTSIWKVFGLGFDFHRRPRDFGFSA